jgi:hypothetical protein
MLVSNYSEYPHRIVVKPGCSNVFAHERFGILACDTVLMNAYLLIMNPKSHNRFSGCVTLTQEVGCALIEDLFVEEEVTKQI